MVFWLEKLICIFFHLFHSCKRPQINTRESTIFLVSKIVISYLPTSSGHFTPLNKLKSLPTIAKSIAEQISSTNVTTFSDSAIYGSVEKNLYILIFISSALEYETSFCGVDQFIFLLKELSWLLFCCLLPIIINAMLFRTLFRSA